MGWMRFGMLCMGLVLLWPGTLMAQGNLPGKGRAMTASSKAEEYRVNGKIVTPAQYQDLAKQLTGQEHWTCEETSEGGRTSWTAKDGAGQRYHVVSEATSTKNLHAISRAGQDGPSLP